MTTTGPGFAIFPPPADLSMEEIFNIDRTPIMGFGERGAPGDPRAGFSGMSTAQKASILTTGLLLTPLIVKATQQKLRGASKFFGELFKGNDQQKAKIIEDLENSFRQDAPSTPEISEVMNNFPEAGLQLAENLKQIIPEFMQPQAGMSQRDASLDTMRNIEFIRGFVTENKNMEYQELIDNLIGELRGMGIDPGTIPDIGGLIDSILGGMEQPGFTANPASGTNATNPDPRVIAETDYLQAKIDEQNRRDKEDAANGILVGQKKHMIDNIERSPDQWLAREQARRQALYQRPVSDTPMQMRNNGLVQQTYYSTRVQQ